MNWVSSGSEKAFDARLANRYLNQYELIVNATQAVQTFYFS